MVNQRTNIEWTSYLACAYAEGFCEGENATTEEQIEAWAYLIHSKLAYSLQGWYGRTARNLIDNNFISENGIINWEHLDAVKNEHEYETE